MLLSTQDNSFKEANNLGTLNGRAVQKNKLSQSDQRDVFKFSLSKSSNFIGVLRGLKANADLTLFDGDRKRIDLSNQQGTQKEQIKRTLGPGTYYVRVSLASRDRTRYALKLVAQENTQAQQILDAHNRYRREVGVPDLSWSDDLATSAQQWANELASTNSFQHSNTPYGENLAQGSAGFYSATDLVDLWGNERSDFIPGRAFPNVSRTGNWQDVGHYTQVVWRSSTQVGCGLVTSNGVTTLVCQYNPPGNVIGQQPY